MSKKIWKNESGASSIIEYSLVLPVCLFLFVFIIIVGDYLHQKAIMDAAVNRAVLIAEKMYKDPNADLLIDFEYKEGDQYSGYKVKNGSFNNVELASKPYRYLLKSQDLNDRIKSYIEHKTLNIIKGSQLVGLKNRFSKLESKAEFKNGFFSSKIVVTAKQDFEFPVLYGINKEAKILTMESSASIHLNNSTEFVRNVDFAKDTLERFLEKDVTDKVNEVFSKISGLFTTEE